MNPQAALKLLSTVRHEWMNRLQMISLYAALEPEKT
ncbi:Spo0B domain-containing protein [Exiguobacterium mexicanum]|nr:Spo0B domain-containing protein [Exiguobacterium mexicanum]MCT4788134.1 Spo0B domain-containing protein [Exiguobacterium mexicanum]